MNTTLRNALFVLSAAGLLSLAACKTTDKSMDSPTPQAAPATDSSTMPPADDSTAPPMDSSSDDQDDDHSNDDQAPPTP